MPLMRKFHTAFSSSIFFISTSAITGGRDHHRFGSLTLLIMSWRWGGMIADSIAYFRHQLRCFFRGEIPASALQAPFAYRLVVPAIAAALPGDLRNGFAALNWLAMTGAASAIALTIVRLGFSLTKSRLRWVVADRVGPDILVRTIFTG